MNIISIFRHSSTASMVALRSSMMHSRRRGDAINQQLNLRFYSAIRATPGSSRALSYLITLAAGCGFACGYLAGDRSIVNCSPENTNCSGREATISANISEVFEIFQTLSAEDLENKIKDIESKHSGKPIFILFYAEKTDGISWCPDCRRAEPIIISALEKLCPNSILVVVNVNKAEYKSSTNYSYREEPFLLKCVPTFSRYFYSVRTPQ